MNSRHAAVRAQERCIPPLMDELLDRYGKEQYDGHAAVVVYLDKASIRSMERDFGRRPVSRLSEWFDAYKIRALSDGSTITTGHRTERIRLP